MIRTLSIALSLCLLSACADLPPQSGTAPTAQQQKISAELQTVADAIRHAENAGFTPAQFNAFLATWTAFIPAVQPYVAGAEAAYAILYAGGSLTAEELERLAVRYDS